MREIALQDLTDGQTGTRTTRDQEQMRLRQSGELTNALLNGAATLGVLALELSEHRGHVAGQAL